MKNKYPKAKEVKVDAPKKKESKEKSEKYPDHAKLLSWLTFADEAAKRKHWEYFVIDQFLRGNHNVRGDPSDNTLVVGKRQEAINFPINKIYSTFRAVRAFVTRHKPKVEVDPEDSTDEAKTYARRATKTIERDNQLNNGRRLNKEWVYYGIKYGIGWRQIGYDKDKKVCIRWTIDPTDLLIGSKTGRAEDAPYLIKTLVRTVGYWKSKFPDKDIVADNEVAYDEYKKLAMQINFYTSGETQQSSDEQTATGFECWYRLFKPNSMGGLINKCLFTKTEILQAEETPFTEYPFIPYEAEVSPNEAAPDGHLKHVIAPQRMLNLLNTQLLEYNHIVNRGRFLKDKNSGFRAIFAKEGQIIEKNVGKRVESLAPPPLNPALRDQLGLAEAWVDEIGGSSDASRGVAPYAGASGEAIEKLQVGDSNNISDLRDNFEDSLAKEAAWILKMYSLFERDGVVINDKLPDEKIDQFGIVGKEAINKVPEKYFIEENGSYCDICAILPDNNVKVSVTSELGETKGARTELLLRLFEVGVIPAKTVLEFLEFPNTGDILQRVAEETIADIMMEKMKTAQPTETPVPGQLTEQEETVPAAPQDEMQAIDQELEAI